MLQPSLHSSHGLQVCPTPAHFPHHSQRDCSVDRPGPDPLFFHDAPLLIWWDFMSKPFTVWPAASSAPAIQTLLLLFPLTPCYTLGIVCTLDLVTNPDSSLTSFSIRLPGSIAIEKLFISKGLFLVTVIIYRPYCQRRCLHRQHTNRKIRTEMITTFIEYFYCSTHQTSEWSLLSSLSSIRGKWRTEGLRNFSKFTKLVGARARVWT